MEYEKSRKPDDVANADSKREADTPREQVKATFLQLNSSSSGPSIGPEKFHRNWKLLKIRPTVVDEVPISSKNLEKIILKHGPSTLISIWRTGKENLAKRMKFGNEKPFSMTTSTTLLPSTGYRWIIISRL